MSHYSENVMSWAEDARKRGDVVAANDLECASAHIAKLSRQIEQHRDALTTLSHIRDGNPSLAMADTPPLDYARHMLFEARQIAKQALAETDN